MSYEQIKKLRPVDFKRYCGVKPHTFQKMVEVFAEHLKKTRRKPGRPPKLAVEDQILMTLEYWREYRTYFHIAQSWGIAESNVSRIIRREKSSRRIRRRRLCGNLPVNEKLIAATFETFEVRMP